MHEIRAKGFTLVELMTVIAVLAVLVTIALPSFQGTFRSNRVATATNELLATIALARTEAIRSSGHGRVCASTDSVTCDTTDWNSGWIVWTDTNDNSLVDGTEVVARRVESRSKVVFTGADADFAFDSRGRSVDGEFQIGIQPEDYVAGYPVRCVEIGVVGQTRVKKEECES